MADCRPAASRPAHAVWCDDAVRVGVGFGVVLRRSRGQECPRALPTGEDFTWRGGGFGARHGGTMARSVVLKGTIRCAGCQLAPRWCICEAMTPVDVPVGVEVLMHFKEAYRPSSTGHLIGRLVRGAVVNEYRPDLPPPAITGDGPVWVLHPSGDVPPAGRPPAGLRVVLIDGSWQQAAGMLRTAASRGRCIRLPMTGESRYRLRSQQEGG